MDNVRYYAALVLVMGMPGGLLYWFSIHPFIGFWRKVGPRKTIAAHMAGIFVLAFLIYLVRAPLLAVEFGTQPFLMVPAVLLIVISGILRVQVSRQLTKKILLGMPELAPEKFKTPLLTEGLYARVRNPRYLQILVALGGWALFSNYLAVYILFGASVILLRLVIRMEEKELRSRFGKAFDEYCARVPRLVPKWRVEQPLEQPLEQPR